MKFLHKRTYILMLCCTAVLKLQTQAQQLQAFGPYSLNGEKDRNSQILGVADSLGSLSIRTPQSAPHSHQTRFELLPISLLQQYNTYAPYGWNDGAMIAAKGYQTYLTAGFAANLGSWKLQIQPEYTYAQNKSSKNYLHSESEQVRSAYLIYLNYTDIPEQFGQGSYTKLHWGQSSLTYQIKKWEIGLSTQNRWWGPGTRNALILSNNASGFLHLTLNTTAPLKTAIGSFETQLIAGKLEGSNLGASAANFTLGQTNAYIPKRDNWRYLSGLSINYQPKWIPGLYLGLNRVFQIYQHDLGNGISDYLPVITPFQKKSVPGEDAKNRDQLASVFFRWVMPESKSEIYAEYGRNDHSQNIWDFATSPSHSSALLIGMRKLFPIQGSNQKYIRVNLEVTQLQQSADRLVRPAGAWYMHGSIRHGYTHQGQVLGAGIGPGSNSQTLDIAFWNKNQVFGFQLERYAHNLDFFYDAYTEVWKDYNRKWTDIMLNTYTYRQWGKIGLRAALNAAWIRNYQWQENRNPLNIQVQLGLNYRFSKQN